MTATTVVSRYRQVTAVLDDPSFLVPEADTDAQNGIGWLRARVSRFANGTEHAHRREQIVATLGELDVLMLRAEASARANAILDAAANGRLDVMSELARRAPLAVLGEALALNVDTAALAEAVMRIAPAYPPGSPADREAAADEAVEQLVADIGARDETTVTQLTLLVQACDATAGLIGNSANIALRLPPADFDVDGLLAETLRHSPPVRSTRRLATVTRRIGDTTIEQGNIVVLDFDAANRDPELFADPHRFDPLRAERHVTLGHGFRACPAHDHAFALSAGVVAAVLSRCEVVAAETEYEPSPNLRVPASLWVSTTLQRRSTNHA